VDVYCLRTLTTWVRISPAAYTYLSLPIFFVFSVQVEVLGYAVSYGTNPIKYLQTRFTERRNEGPWAALTCRSTETERQNNWEASHNSSNNKYVNTLINTFQNPKALQKLRNGRKNDCRAVCVCVYADLF
jgi:hypothetical protein